MILDLSRLSLDELDALLLARTEEDDGPDPDLRDPEFEDDCWEDRRR